MRLQPVERRCDVGLGYVVVQLVEDLPIRPYDERNAARICLALVFACVTESARDLAIGVAHEPLRRVLVVLELRQGRDVVCRYSHDVVTELIYVRQPGGEGSRLDDSAARERLGEEI